MSIHKEEAFAREASLNEWHAEEGMTDATMISSSILAQVHATLYLAEQQRIANLIALGITHIKGESQSYGTCTVRTPDRLRPDIETGLGL